jgi:hypothetical protein
VIFFARYEASQYGCPHIETDHILLAIFREDRELMDKVLTNVTFDDIRKQVEEHTGIRPATPTSVDLPLSNEGKRVLAYAAEESERFSRTHIAPKHLLMGLLREEGCFAAVILRNHGLTIEALRAEVAKPDIVPRLSQPPEVSVVTITSNPTGAEIEVDGKFLGNTPAEVPLTAREWTIRVAKTGFQLWERKLLVLPQAKQHIAVDLVKAE